MNKDKSVQKLDKNKCLSCRACENICPVNAIKMTETKEGFYFPEVEDCCINCGSCAMHCPVLSPVEIGTFQKEAYAVRLNDMEKLSQSASGGAFSGFAYKILEKEGVVFGVSYDEDLNANVISVNNKINLECLKGSKYVEGNPQDSYKQVKDLLKLGKKVLYSGSPCRVAALRKYLGKDEENLYTIDIICHGVPSQKLFNKYLKWLGKKNGGKIIYYGFRDKDVGGWSCGGKAKTKTKTKTKTIDALSDPYYYSFLKGQTYRESCYSCPFANVENRPGDITVGDYWGIDKFLPQFEYKKGVSCLILNTQKGKDFWDEVKNSFDFLPTKIQDIQQENGNLSHPTFRPQIRDSIYKDIDIENLNKYFMNFKVDKNIKRRLRAFISIHLSEKMKQRIKKILGRT